MTSVLKLEKAKFIWLKTTTVKYIFCHELEYELGDKVIAQHEKEPEYELVVDQIVTDPALKKGWVMVLLEEPNKD